MKNIISFCTAFLIFLATAATAANTGPGNNDPEPAAVSKAAFRGEAMDIAEYFNANLIYPAYAREQAIEGEVLISFFVLQDGSIHGARVVNGLHKSCDEAALKVVNEMPKWRPARKYGKAVASKNYVSVSFSLQP